MSSSEPINFGRKIKDLKRLYKKGYSDLCAGLKISRERIVALEENEREPNDTERLRFANFYNLPPEEFGLYTDTDKTIMPVANTTVSPAAGNVVASAPPARPYSNPNPNYNSPNPNYSNPNYVSAAGNSSSGNYQPGLRDSRSNFNNDRMSNTRPNPNQNPNYRPSPSRPGVSGGQPSRPAPGGLGGRSEGATRPPREGGYKAAPKPAPKEKTDNGEPKPIIKYTAEQLGDIESAYLRKQRDLKVPLKFTFLNGKEYTGVVVDFTPFTVHIIESGTGEEVILRKLAMAYYRKADALDEAKAEKATTTAKNGSSEQTLLASSAESE